MNKPGWHILSDIDRTSRTARCSICGPTRIRGQKVMRCLVARKRANQNHQTNIRRYRDKLRDETFLHYGGKECVCGEDDILVLQLDHIQNDGNKHRKTFDGNGCGTELYLFLKKSGFPPGYQVLCANCNIAKARNGGVIPEHRKKLTADEWFERCGVGGI